jgi:hypothetical protein
MGERAPGVERMPAERPDVRPTSREMSQRLGAEIATVREELDVLLAELDRRRHDLLDVRLQLRRHARGTALTTLALAGVAAGAVWLSVGRRRRARRLTADASLRAGAISGVTEHPGRGTAAATMAGKVATAAASAAVTSLVRRALAHAVRRLLAGPSSPSGGRDPAVDRERRARDERRLVGQEKQGRVRDLLGPAGAAERNRAVGALPHQRLGIHADGRLLVRPGDEDA